MKQEKFQKLFAEILAKVDEYDPRDQLICHKETSQKLKLLNIFCKLVGIKRSKFVRNCWWLKFLEMAKLNEKALQKAILELKSLD